MAIIEEDNKQVFQPTAAEDMRLENLGYEQELKRTFGLLGMIGFSFSIVTSYAFHSFLSLFRVGNLC